MNLKQKAAINPSSSVWVSASAGTGKTKVLTNRVLSLLLNGIEPSKILCVTFTKVGASEMLVRINNELSKWAILSDAELKKEIEQFIDFAPDQEVLIQARKLFVKLLDDPVGLKIQTIHSFCQSLLKQFPIEAGISPNFEVIDENTSNELIKRAKILFFTNIKKYKKISVFASMEYLSWHLHEVTFGTLVEELISNRDKLSSIEREVKLEEQIFAKLGFDKIIEEDELLNKFIGELPSLGEEASILLNGNKTDIIRGRFLQNWEKFSKSKKENGYTELLGCFLTKNNEKMQRVFSKELKEKYPELLEKLLLMQEICHKFIQRQKSFRIAAITIHIINISMAIISEYKELKRQGSYLDYHDFIYMTNTLLSQDGISDWVLYKLDNDIEHILVDEAQDTSAIQWQIIKNLCSDFFSGSGAKEENRTVFVVGDKKQSIFSFQGADPNIFEQMEGFFCRAILNAQKDFKSIELDISYRSATPILNLVDQVFKEQNLKHHAFRKNCAGKVEIWPLIEESEDSKLSAKHVLADLIALEIRSWLDQGKILESAARKVKPKDIVILLRKRGDFAKILISKLKTHNVPVAGLDRFRLTETIVVQDLIALAKFALLPEDDLNLACLLKSPIIGLNEEALFNLCSVPNRKTLWQEAQSLQCAELLQQVIDSAINKTPYEFFASIIDVLQIRKNFLTRMGEEVNDNLNEFLNLACKYEQSHTGFLQGFIEWVEQGSNEVKRDADTQSNQVTIMTIHGAKGLQSPIVIIPDTTSVPSRDDLLVWSDENIPFYKSSSLNPLNEYERLKGQKILNNKEEYKRLLYVALTRAEDELIVAGYKGKKEISSESWYNLISQVMKGESDQNSRITISSKQNQKVVEMAEKLVVPEVKIPEKFKQSFTYKKLFSKTTASFAHEFKKSFSKAYNNNDRGKFIHSMLNILPSIEAKQYKEVALDFAKKNNYRFSELQTNEMLDKVSSIINAQEFQFIFRSDSCGEVPIIGELPVNGKKTKISARIDRLIVTEDEVIIIDFKTDKHYPNSKEKIDSGYLRQLEVYHSLLKEVYPLKVVKTMIIWVEGAVAMDLSDMLAEKNLMEMV